MESTTRFLAAHWRSGRRVCELPTQRIQGENNHPDMNMALLTRLNTPGGVLDGDALELASHTLPKEPQALG